jgi:hypothetical protein
LYLFYSCVEQNTPYVLEAYTNEALIDLIHWCETCTNGVFIAPAKYIYTSILDHPRVHISASSILNISLKLSMFDMFMRTDGPNLINTQVEEALNYLNQFCENTLEYSIRYKYGSSIRRTDYRTVPKWLDILIGTSSTAKGIPEWFEREFMQQLPNTSGIASLDLRQKSGYKHLRINDKIAQEFSK